MDGQKVQRILSKYSSCLVFRRRFSGRRVKNDFGGWGFCGIV